MRSWKFDTSVSGDFKILQIKPFKGVVVVQLDEQPPVTLRAGDTIKYNLTGTAKIN